MIDLRVGDRVAWQLKSGDYFTGCICKIIQSGVWVKVYTTTHAIFLEWDKVKPPF